MMDQAIKLYRPSNGTEGESFQAEFCDVCERDRAFRDGGCNDTDLACRILGRTFQYGVDEEEYPDEWRYDKYDRPTCMAFIPAGQKIPVEDDFTIDMFLENAA